jgi:lipopolysaccharide export system permease protein
LLIYMTYNNLLSIVQAWIAQSRVTFAAALGVHLVMLVILVLLFYRRLVVFSFFRLMR